MMDTLPEMLTLPPGTLSGAGAIAKLMPECRKLGRRGLLVHGGSLAAGGTLRRLLETAPADSEVLTWRHPGGEPDLGQLDALLAAARGHRTDWIAAVGGGSVMDIGKACAGLLDEPLAPVAYHRGAPLSGTRLPFVAAPTTAGTGSEATSVSVLTDRERGIKKSIRHPTHLPRLVILDPALLAGCPPPVVAASGMDAFTQAVESFVSRGATWFSDALAFKAVRLIDAALPAVFGDRGDTAAALRLLQGSYLAGLALSHARLGIVHGLAHPLGYRYKAAHGLVCGICLPTALAFNRPVIGEKYDRLSRAVGGDLIGHVQRRLAALNLHSPFAGRPVEDIAGITVETLASGSTAANPRPVREADVHGMLAALAGESV